jgi:hypothetical protein
VISQWFGARTVWLEPSTPPLMSRVSKSSHSLTERRIRVVGTSVPREVATGYSQPRAPSLFQFEMGTMSNQVKLDRIPEW